MKGLSYVASARFTSIVDRDAESGLRIRILQVPFPCSEAGLPDGCESMDMLPSKDLLSNFLVAMSMLQQPLEKLIDELEPRASCMIADKFQAWTTDTAQRFQIPLLVFDGTSCFSYLCTHNILASKVHETASELEPFVVPGLPDQIVLTRSQLPNGVLSSNIGIHAKTNAISLSAFGVVVNSFEELEPAYVNELKKVRGGKVWCVGPVSLCNKYELDKAERGDKASITKEGCLKWLDSQGRGSVVYACLGSFSRVSPAQLIELGAGLEASGRPFIWVIRGGNKSLDQLENWLSEENFEERTKSRGLLIRGWAPQVLILSHPAIGGFLTHCGWNSTLEAVSAGVPMVTWPLFAEQFYNEKMIVQVLRIGVGIGAESSIGWGEGELLVSIKRENVKKAVDELMDGGRRRRGEKKES
ncbi:hypothetical protein Ancab_014471 [Ancistrocladus abbreviatus]